MLTVAIQWVAPPKHRMEHNANPITPHILCKICLPNEKPKDKTYKGNIGFRQGRATYLLAHRLAPASCPLRLALHCVATDLLSMHRVFPHRAKQKRHRNIHARLHLGQAMRLSMHCPAQRLARTWGRYTAALNAAQNGLFYPCIAFFNILATKNNT